MRVAIIPARGGSRNPQKNIHEINGHPLIGWTITQALNTKCIDRVIVSTDDKIIADIARSYGAEVPFIRPASLATDTATTEGVLSHVLDWITNNDPGYSVAEIVLLQPTSQSEMHKP